MSVKAVTVGYKRFRAMVRVKLLDITHLVL